MQQHFYKNVSTLLLVIVFVALSSLFPSFAGNKEDIGNVTIMIVDGLSAEDFFANEKEMKNLKSFNGSFSLMNTNTAGRKTSENAYITIGSGIKSLATENSGLSLQGNEPFMDTDATVLFHGLTGYKNIAQNIIQPNIAELIKVNADKDYGSVPGALGEELHKNGYKTCVIGNGDNSERYRRLGTLVAMDGKGIVDGGWISSDILKQDQSSTFGKTTDYNKVYEYYSKNKSLYDLIILDFADIARVEDNSNLYSIEALALEKKTHLAAVDGFIGEIKPLIGKSDLFIFVTPTVSSYAISEGSTFSVIYAYGSDYSGGILKSGSTRRTGIVLNTDIAPTVLKHFNLQSAVFSGSPLQSVSIENSDKIEFLKKINEKTMLVSGSRVLLVQSYVFLQIITLILAFSAIVFKGFLLAKCEKTLIWALFGMTAFPLVFMLMPFFNNWIIASGGGVLLEILLIIFMTILITYLMRKVACNNILLSFVICALLTLTVVIADTFMGSPLAKYSLLSYDPIIGARFYGVGNEYAGIIVGAFIVAYASLFELLPSMRKILKFSGIPLLAFLCYFSASPTLAADFGGVIIVLLGLGYTYLLLVNNGLTLKQVLWLVIILVAAITVVGVLDVSKPIEAQSHLGRALSLFKDDGIMSIIDIIKRKLSMNFRLIFITKWSFALLTSLISLFIFYFRPVGLLKNVLKRYPYLRMGFLGSVVSAVVAFIFNDSGVVAVGTLNIFPVMLLVSLMLDLKMKTAEDAERGKNINET